MKKQYKNELKFVIILAILGQFLFAIFSSGFTTPGYESRIYATTGVKHKQEDLHKLNEAAHYFGQTIIGWLKFPSFMKNLSEAAELPEGSTMSAYIQERQNIIFLLKTPIPIEPETLYDVKDFLQWKLDQYNSVNQTEFILSNLDYEQIETKKSYSFGTIVALLISIMTALGLIFIGRELL